jgi:outer membrane biosynthesis protein TonB
VQENLIYPESAIKNHVSAKIFVQFAVNEHGKVVDVKVVHVKTLDEKGNEIVSKENNPDKNMNVDQKALKDLEKEAVRVIKSLKDFTPAQKDGKNVEVQYTMPVSFVLDSKKDK